MNRAYKLVWNTAQQAWTVASELARGKTKSSAKGLKLAVVLLTSLSAVDVHAAEDIEPVFVAVLPTGESIASGSATFDRSVVNQLTVNQSSSKLITNWSSFNVSSGGKVIFAQPDASSIALNRVTTGSPTQIFGQVTANGQLVIVNPNGITFGAGSQVSAASIIGSVLDIQDSDFNSGNLLFNRGSATAAIDNQGSLTATAGSVSLLAPIVKNSGTISAAGGNANLMNADGVNLSTVDPAVTTASSIAGLVKNSGSLQATQLSSVGGKILLLGDTSQASSKVELTGTLTAEESSINAQQINVAGVLNVDGTNNILKLSSTTPYNLTFGSKINLNGASSGFSVNGTAYTVIRDVNQLQAMNSNLAGKYVLANDVDASDTVNWNAGAGFAPVGNDSTRFTGVLDGLGHEVEDLVINRPGVYIAGLIGVAQNSLIQNIGVSGSVIGGTTVGGLVGAAISSTVNNSYMSGNVGGNDYVGGLVGYSASSSAINNSYASSNVTGSDNFVGGLLGYNNISSTVTNSYATGAVIGSNDYVGGLVGISNNSSMVSNSYATGGVTSNGGLVGGLVGYNSVSTVINSYATGIVSSSSSSRGGLLGSNNNGTVTNNYWDTDTTGQANGVGLNNGGTLTNLVGLTSSQMKNLSSFANWGSTIDAQAGTGSVWRIYDGMSAPLLRSFLTPLTDVVVNNATTTYDGSTYSAFSFNISDAGIDVSKIIGAVNGGRNAGTYTLNAYSGQQGYDFEVTTGTLNINKANLVISSADVNKTYDGTTSAAGSAIATAGTLLFDTDSISGGTFAFDNKHAGTGKHVIVSGVVVNDGNSGNNYNVTYADNTGSTINKASLVLTTSDVTKTYDGTTSAAGTALATSGTQVFAGDSLSGGTFAFDNKHAGTGKTVSTSGVTVNDGNNGDNYNVSYADNTNSSVDKANLVITTNNVTKTYDGTTSAKGSAVATAGTQVFAGDTLTGGIFAFTDKNAGTDKTVTTAGVTVNDGNGGDNYNISYADNVNSIINKRLLTISATAVNKVYDGKLTTGTDRPLVTGRQRGDSITGLSQSFLDKNVGSGKTVRVNNGFVVNDGHGGNNYDVVLLADNVNGVITPRTLTISTVANSKVYDGSVKAANKPLVTGLASGDRLTGLYQQYETKLVGENKKMLIKAGYVLKDGNNGGNYTVTEQTSNDGIITAH